MTTPQSFHEQFKSDSELLAEVLDYLQRMPPVHTTLTLVRKLQAHIEEPTRMAAERAVIEAARTASETARLAGLRHGSNLALSGLPVIEAALDGDVLRLWTPGDDHFETQLEKAEWGRTVTKRLQEVETIHLRLGPAIYVPPIER